MNLNAQDMGYRQVNEAILACPDTDIEITGLCGQRYLASGLAGKRLVLHGTPGNALGAYLCSGCIDVHGNAQDALGDTMDGGEIIVRGSAGDAPGYAMRGGRILVRGNVGYRAGIHMKAYQDKNPLLVVGGCAGHFLGEYLAGGTIAVLGLDGDGQQAPVGAFCGTGMHGGRIYLRCRKPPQNLPPQVVCRPAEEGDKAALEAAITPFCQAFSLSGEEILAHPFYILTPNTKNPYKQLYTMN
nr:glutamate synthase [bacterium]